MEITTLNFNGEDYRMHCPPGYSINSEGVYKGAIHYSNKICDPIWVSEIIRFKEDKQILIEIKGLDITSGEVFEFTGKRSNLISDYANALIRDLVDIGAGIEPDKKSELLQFLQKQKNVNSAIYAVKKIGWDTDRHGNKVFVLPKEIIGSSTDRLMYLPAYNLSSICSLRKLENINLSDTGIMQALCKLNVMATNKRM